MPGERRHRNPLPTLILLFHSACRGGYRSASSPAYASTLWDVQEALLFVKRRPGQCLEMVAGLCDCLVTQTPGHWMHTRRICQEAPARLGFLALHYTSKFSACKRLFLGKLQYFLRKTVESSCSFSSCSLK